MQVPRMPELRPPGLRCLSLKKEKAKLEVKVKVSSANECFAIPQDAIVIKLTPQN
jgi:hypothetical protein